MASGKTHSAVTVIASIGLMAASFKYGEAMIPVGLGCMAGLLLSPDLDIDGRTRSEGLVFEKLGCLPGGLWYLLWLPYAKLIPHRSPISHAPIVSTIIRLIYLLAFLSPFLLAIDYYYPGQLDTIYSSNPSLLWLMVGGLMISDALHTLFDMKLRL